MRAPTTFNGTAAQIMEVEPGHPDHLCLAHRHGTNGPGGYAKVASRFFVNPNDPGNVYIVDSDGIKRSDDSGGPWELDAGLNAYLTANGTLKTGCWDTTCSLDDLVVDRDNPKRRFAIGVMGVFATADGVTWHRLLDARALSQRAADGFLRPHLKPPGSGSVCRL